MLHPNTFSMKKIGPRIIKTYEKLRSEKSSTDGHVILLKGYAISAFRDSESNLRIVVGLVEDDIKLILEQYNSFFIADELSPGVYSIKDNSEAVYTKGDHEKTIQSEDDNISMKTNFILTHLRSTFGTLRFYEKSFLLHDWALHHIGFINLLMQFMVIPQVYTLVTKF